MYENKLKSKKVAIITGATSGMGREFANIIGKEFNSIDEIWLIARRKQLLEEVREEINKPCNIICEDVSEEGFFNRFRTILKQENVRIKMLINCAGFGILGKVEETADEVSLGMIKTNCVGLTVITKMALPYMMENSRIINLASSAAFAPQPEFAIYAASKSYVLSFSRALNEELRSKSIFVTAVCPGPVATDFFRIAEGEKKRAWFKDLFMSDCNSVVRKALTDSINKKPVSIYGKSMKLFYIISRIVPHGIILKILDIFSK